jgi:hypothetical protein
MSNGTQKSTGQCVLCDQMGPVKCLRGPLAASALDVATVPAPPHTRRRPQHSLGRVWLGMDEQRDPKVHRPLCVLCDQTGASKCLRGPLAASALDVATVPAPPHTRRRPQHSLGRVWLGVDEQRGPKVHRPLCVLREQTGAAKCLRAFFLWRVFSGVKDFFLWRVFSGVHVPLYVMCVYPLP